MSLSSIDYDFFNEKHFIEGNNIPNEYEKLILNFKMNFKWPCELSWVIAISMPFSQHLRFWAKVTQKPISRIYDNNLCFFVKAENTSGSEGKRFIFSMSG